MVLAPGHLNGLPLLAVDSSVQKTHFNGACTRSFKWFASLGSRQFIVEFSLNIVNYNIIEFIIFWNCDLSPQMAKMNWSLENFFWKQSLYVGNLMFGMVWEPFVMRLHLCLIALLCDQMTLCWNENLWMKWHCDVMNILWSNDYILSGLYDIFCIRTYSLTTFAKEVFWLEAPVKLWRNEHFVTKWLHI